MRRIQRLKFVLLVSEAEERTGRVRQDEIDRCTGTAAATPTMVSLNATLAVLSIRDLARCGQLKSIADSRCRLHTSPHQPR